MRVALIGAELEENLALRYMTSALESRGHEVSIIPFNFPQEIPQVVNQVIPFQAKIIGLSMVFTGRAREFCHLAEALRASGYRGHIVAGGHFASFNCERLLEDYPAFDSIGLGEGEELICALADNLENLFAVPGLCFRGEKAKIHINPVTAPAQLDTLQFPKRIAFHDYFGKPVANILSSRGCWRNCAFCSINAWYKHVGGRKFRIRSIENIVGEMKLLYFQYGVRIFNFQDDNFYLPDSRQALKRFLALRDGLREAGVDHIAIAIKARPDSITEETVAALDELGLFRVFLGVENASENGLQNLNRRCRYSQILESLRILNDFDIHVAYNLLMFEPDTVLDDILANLKFMERHLDNPFNFCRAEAYAGTGLEAQLRSRGLLSGDCFGFDYRIRDAQAEAFHQIANFAFFDRNFSDQGLHYFNMQVDFYMQLLRRFYPEALTMSLRSAARNFIKFTNLDTYEQLCMIYDFDLRNDPDDQNRIRQFALAMRTQIDIRSRELKAYGGKIIDEMTAAYEQYIGKALEPSTLPFVAVSSSSEKCPLLSHPAEEVKKRPRDIQIPISDLLASLGLESGPVPYDVFKQQVGERRC